jgi:hypothetical protein
MLLTANTKVMGQFTVSGVLRFAGWLATAVMAAAVVRDARYCCHVARVAVLSGTMSATTLMTRRPLLSCYPRKMRAPGSFYAPNRATDAPGH